MWMVRLLHICILCLQRGSGGFGVMRKPWGQKVSWRRRIRSFSLNFEVLGGWVPVRELGVVFRYHPFGIGIGVPVPVPNGGYLYPEWENTQFEPGLGFLTGASPSFHLLDILGTPTIFPSTLNRLLPHPPLVSSDRRKERE